MLNHVGGPRTIGVGCIHQVPVRIVEADVHVPRWAHVIRSCPHHRSIDSMMSTPSALVVYEITINIVHIDHVSLIVRTGSDR